MNITTALLDGAFALAEPDDESHVPQDEVVDMVHYLTL
jgi:hypothetical protein